MSAPICISGLLSYSENRSLVPVGAGDRQDSMHSGFRAMWPCLVATERTPARSLLISRGRLHPAGGLAPSKSSIQSAPHLEQSLIKLHYLLLEHLRPSLLSKRRRLHSSWQQIEAGRRPWQRSRRRPPQSAARSTKISRIRAQCEIRPALKLASAPQINSWFSDREAATGADHALVAASLPAIYQVLPCAFFLPSKEADQ